MCTFNKYVWMNFGLALYLRCYVVGSELRGHQVSLINFGKAKVTELHRSVLQKRQNHLGRASTETHLSSFLENISVCPSLWLH